jgi:hypothetical protein
MIAQCGRAAKRHDAGCGAFTMLFIYSLSHGKSRLNCGNDETESRTIQFSFCLNGVTVSLYATEQMCVPPPVGARMGRRHV